MKRKIIPLGLLFAVTLNIVKADHGMPPMVTNVNYQQRTEPDDPNGGYRLTKFVDITYDLEGNRSCFVEFFFSYDGGITFPILCTSMTGAQGPGIDPGYGLTATWDAGTDWNQQYTDRARIRIKATYGDSPTGNPFLPDLNGTYPGMPDSNATDLSAYPGPPYAASDLTVVVPAPQSKGPDYGPSSYMLGPQAFPRAITMYADKFEVTYGLWEKVRQWGRDNGYADLVTFDQSFHYDQPYEAVDLNDITSILNTNMPADPTGMTNSSESDRLVIMEQVMKWMNARSEMEGFEPAYYVDGEEPVTDDNGDGVITQGGTDSWRPDFFDDPEDPNFEDPFANPDDLGADPFDPNGNYRWDPGEYFVDRNGNGIFEPMEFYDLNGNRIRDTGHTLIYRVGSINWDTNGDGLPDPIYGMPLNYRKASNGYALPDYEMIYLTYGGRPENTYFHTDPMTGASIAGWQVEWPWGGIMDFVQSADPSMGSDPTFGYDPSIYWGSDYLMPPESVDYISNLGDNPMGVVGTKMPNGYGMYDTLGNYEELQNSVFAWNIVAYGQGAYGVSSNQDGSLVPLGFRGIRVDYATD